MEEEVLKFLKLEPMIIDDTNNTCAFSLMSTPRNPQELQPGQRREPEAQAAAALNTPGNQMGYTMSLNSVSVSVVFLFNKSLPT